MRHSSKRLNPTLLGCAILFLACLPLCAQRLTYGYRLPAGQDLVYQTTGVTRYAHDSAGYSRRSDFWVLYRNDDGSCPLVIRQSLRSWRMEKGARVEDDPAVDWARCTLHPDGHVTQRYSSGDVALEAIFVPLPRDTLAVKPGWSRPDSAHDETDDYRVDHIGPGDSLCVIEDVHHTPLDAVYEISTRSLVSINLNRGLPVRRETHSTQGYGSRKTDATTVLDRIVPLDSALTRRLAPQVLAFLHADSIAGELSSQAEDSTGKAVWLLSRADSILRNACPEITDSALAARLSQNIADNAQALDAAKSGKGGDPTDSLIGKPAPYWKLVDLDGAMHSLKQYRGKIVLLDFCYRGCPWCIRAEPQINKLAQDYAGKPVQVFGMTVDKDTADTRFVVSQLKLVYPQLRARDQSKPYRVSGYPTMFIIDRKGIVRNVHIGYTPDIGARVAKVVERLLAEQNR